MAQDCTAQRRNVANRVVDAANRLVVALYDLSSLRDQMLKLSPGFQDADFDSQAGLSHLTVGMLNVLRDNVIPAVTQVYKDAVAYTPDGGNLGRNEQILQQVRKG